MNSLQSNHRSVSELLFCFGEVDDVTPAPDVITGDGDGFALLFDMNEVFEKYIGRVVKKHCSISDIQVQLQGPKLCLAQRKNGDKVFQRVPDIVGRGGDKRNAWIIDTKWKKLDSSKNKDGVSSSDMYQMYAYARQVSGRLTGLSLLVRGV